MKAILNIITVLTFILALGLMGLIAFWEIYPYNPVTITHQPLPVNPKVIKSGKSFNLTIDYCKYMNLPTVVSRRFIDELVYAAPTITTNNPMGCHSVVAEVNVPEGLPPDNYFIEQIFTYQVNPIRTITVSVRSEQFQVVE